MQPTKQPERTKLPHMRPELLPDALVSRTQRVHNVLQWANETGHARFPVEDNDQGVATGYNEGLAGCSDYTYNTIIMPLQDVEQRLRVFKTSFESWAVRAQRMKNSQRFMIHLRNDRTQPRSKRIEGVKDVLFNQVGKLDGYYTTSFETYAHDLDPIITSLSALQTYIAQTATELSITFATDEASSPEPDSDDDSSTDSQQTIRPARPHDDHDDGSEAMEIDTPEASQPLDSPARLHLDPNASPIDRIYLLAMHLTTSSLKQARKLQRLAAEQGALAVQMARSWQVCRGWVVRQEAKGERRRKERLAARGIVEEEEGEEEDEWFDTAAPPGGLGPRVDSAKCGYL